jgi:hypothetical protein
MTPVVDVLQVASRADVLKGEKFETCMRTLRITTSVITGAAMRKGDDRAVCAAAVDVTKQLFDTSVDARLIARADRGGADCMRARAFCAFTFAAIDYLEGGEVRVRGVCVSTARSRCTCVRVCARSAILPA